MPTMTPASFVDADGHVLEHPSGMLDYAPAAFRDRIWHVETDGAGRDWVVFDGARDPANVFAYAGSGGLGPEEQARAAAGEIRYAEIRPGAFEPGPRVIDLDAERIDQTVLYPTNLLGVAGLHDVDFAVAQCRAYNDWLSDFCAASPQRLFGVAIIPQQDPEAAAAELRRAAAKPTLVGTFSGPPPSSTGSTSTTRCGTRSGAPRPTRAGPSGSTRSSRATCPVPWSGCTSTRSSRAPG